MQSLGNIPAAAPMVDSDTQIRIPHTVLKQTSKGMLSVAVTHDDGGGDIQVNPFKVTRSFCATAVMNYV